jgi:hypothetical protein
MKKTRTEHTHSEQAGSVPASQRTRSETAAPAESAQIQLKSDASQKLAASLNNSSAFAAQSNAVNNLASSQLSVAQGRATRSIRSTGRTVAQAQAAEADALPFANSEIDYGASGERQAGPVSGGKAGSSGSAAAPVAENPGKAIDPKTGLGPTSEQDAPGSIGKAEVSPWMRAVGMRLLAMEEPDPVKEKKKPNKPEPGPGPGPKPAPGPVVKPTEIPAGVPNHFLKTPTKYPKLKKADSSFQKYKEQMAADAEKEKAGEQAGKQEDGSKLSGEESKQAETYTDGAIALVKKGFKNAMALKTAYEEYQLIKENTDEDPSKMEIAKAAFDTALSGTAMALSAFDNYQKSFGAGASLAMKAAIPAVGIVMSTISLIGRIVTLVRQNKLDLGKTAEESQSDSILSQVQGDEKKKSEVKAILQSEKFRSIVVATAEYRQQERDNPAIFSEYRKSLDDKTLQERLRKRYPDNFARIEEISRNNNMSLDKLGPQTEQLMAMGVTSRMLDAIIDDQTLINHLQEIKEKRSTNAKIGIFTDLVNIGGDIATLTGAGAIVGTAMKAGAAAIDVARSGGNAIKFAARNKGASNFAEGGEGGLWGASIFDSTDILKNEEAKEERYFHSSRRLVENIADHDKRVVDAGTTPSKEQVDSINKAYGWVETKILGTGASVTLIKAMASADSKSANELVGYFMDKMKTR